MPQSSAATFLFSQNPNHPATFARKPSSTPIIPSAPNTKSLGLSPLDIAHPILQPLKLFFERFPSWVDYHDLKKAFLKFGRVTKLFISKRKTTLGQRFGFVDILSSMSVNDLCDHASSLWFDTYKLRVNPAKHSPSTPTLTPTKPLPKPAPLYPPKLLFRDNRSFTEVLTSTKPPVVSDERRIINYNSTAKDKEWLSRSLVGTILPNADVATMEEMVLKSVENAVSFIFLGASQVIVTFEDQLAARKEQNNARSFLYSLLSNLRQWEARICAYDRFAWISIFGLPMEGWNRNYIDALLQSWGNIVGYDTSCVSQGSISGIKVLIRTSKLEPLQGQVLLNLDGIQVEVSLTEIKGTYIPSLTTVKHSMDVSHYTASGLSDDDEDDHGDAPMRATLSHRTTGQSAEFEFDHIVALGINNSFDRALTEQVMPPMYLYPELTEPCKQVALAEESVYEVDNCLALVRYDYAKVDAADYRIVVGQPVVCLSEVKELDRVGGYTEPKKTGRKQRQKQHFIGPTTTATSTDTGPSFTNFIQPIADPSELCILESKNKKSQKHRAKRIKRKTSSLSRRKSRKLAHHRQKQPETVIIKYSVSDNGIKNRNAIICCGKEQVGDDEASSSRYQSPAAHGNQVVDTLRSDSWEEANACWEVGKAILQVHDDNRLMTQTIQGLIENEQEEWLRRKKE
ncbi:hypothetical protein NC651_002658 [Populus alba x Populus x berolinensis]|nr:hypothetical protein NC651_002658 [Populus alba x Populus x berolinensis]